MRRLIGILLLAPLASCGSSNESSPSGGNSPSGDASLSGDAGNEASGLAPSEAGSDGGAALGIYANGTRLRARTLSADGGAKVLVGIHDKMLDVDCTLSKDTSGKRYCMPTGDKVVYADAGCTMPFALHPNCDSPRKYARKEVDERLACEPYDPTVTAYSLGASTGPATKFFIAQPGGICGENNVPNVYEMFALGNVVDPSAFVPIEEGFDPVAPGLLDHIQKSADGLRWVDAVYDAASKKPCGLLLDAIAAPKSARCHTGNIAYSDNGGGPFVDTKCAEQATDLSHTTTCRVVPDIVEVFTLPLDCGFSTISYHSVGAKLDTVYVGNKCTAETNPGDFHAVGDLADLSGLPLLTQSLEGTGTVHSATWKAGNTPVLPMYDHLIDDQQGRINTVRFPDKSLRGTTSAAFVVSSTEQLQFSDSACTQRVLFQSTDPKCAPAPLSAIILADLNSCGASATEAFALGAPTKQDKYWARAPGTTDCAETDTPGLLYPFGAKKAATDFTELHDAVE